MKTDRRGYTMLRGTLPEPTPSTAWFWEAAARGELHVQACDACGGRHFPPRPFCPSCGNRDVTALRCSGRATLHSYVINHMVPKDGDGPYAVAVVRLEEGPMMMTNIVDCPQTPEALVLDMALEVVFDRVSDTITLAKFRPAGTAASGEAA